MSGKFFYNLIQSSLLLTTTPRRRTLDGGQVPLRTFLDTLSLSDMTVQQLSAYLGKLHGLPQQAFSPLLERDQLW